jgi:hypothetical protein
MSNPTDPVESEAVESVVERAAKLFPPVEKPAEDKLAPFRALFGMPVAVQFAQQVPYVQIAPLIDKEGRPQMVRVPGSDRVIGLPGIVEPAQPTHVAIGVLRASECGTWLIIEERLGIPRTGESPGGQALMDVHVRPEMVTHVSFVRAVELTRRHDHD